MTILQLRYVIVIAASHSFREAAGRLFISQPALSSTVGELENELGIQIFERTNRGIRLTKEGEEFLVYAKEAVSQYKLIEDRYIGRDKDTKHFDVSMQHYVFAVHAFIETTKKYDSGKYVFSVNETRTNDVLSSVRDLKSEVGVLSFAKNNEKLINKVFREYNLVFTPLMKRETYVYLGKNHRLANRDEISLEELKDYPCISFDQKSDSSLYLPEEALSDYEFDKLIKSNDRATTTELMAILNGYSIGVGNITDSVTLKDEIVSIKLKEQDPLFIGYIVRDNHNLSDVGETYIEELLKYKEIEK